MDLEDSTRPAIQAGRARMIRDLIEHLEHAARQLDTPEAVDELTAGVEELKQLQRRIREGKD